MIRRVIAQRWDDLLQDYVSIPLDDADSWTIQLARHIAGREMSDVQLRRVVRQLTIINRNREEVKKI